ncbi:MAG: YhcB family protein [Pseudomonadaceae bacterium]|nr:YhcB family protein [Pseudomonadaceae bacterium]
MNFADVQWFYILTSFFAGGVLGALLYRLMNAGAAQSTKIRHQLTERELELNQVRENLNDHFSRTASNISSLAKQLQNMEEQLASDANQLCSDEGVIKRLAIKSANQSTEQLALDDQHPPKDYVSEKAGGTLAEEFQQPSFEPPRDYASDKTGGTLAEDFGLKPEAFAPVDKK